MFEYDTLGRRITTTRGDGVTATVAYDDVANLVTATDEEARVQVTRLDLEGRVAEVVNAASARKVLESDLVGNKTLEIDPLGRETTLRYDELNRLIKTREAEWKPQNRRTTQRRFDANGNLTEETLRSEVDGLNADQVRRVVNDVANRRSSRSMPRGRARAHDPRV